MVKATERLSPVLVGLDRGPTTAATEAQLQTRGHRRRLGRRQLVPWLFILPIALIHLIVVIGPTVMGLYYSLTDWSGIGAADFIGVENFRVLFFEDETFRRALLHNLIWMAFFLTVPFSIALLAAALVAQVRRGGLAIRALFILPYLLPSVVAAQIWRVLLHPDLGVAPRIAGLEIAWLGNGDTALAAIMVAAAWTWWGFLMTLLLTAIQAISRDLFDAAKIDGAGRWQEFRHVTLPGIRPTLVFLLMMSAIWAFQGFDFVWILTQGGPAGSSELLSTYIYKRAFLQFDVGYATAVGLTVTCIAIFTVSLFVIMRRRGWDI